MQVFGSYQVDNTPEVEGYKEHAYFSRGLIQSAFNAVASQQLATYQLKMFS
jgi:hypothetical protein